jgi:hypothetical protein
MASVVEDGFRQVGTLAAPAYAPPTEAPASPIQFEPDDTDTDEPESPKATERRNLRYRFWVGLLERARATTSLHAKRSPTHSSWLSTGAGISGLSFTYSIWEHESGVELYIDRGKESEAENKQIFDALASERRAIESAFGGSLDWERLDNRRASRIRSVTAGGGYRDEERWPVIHDTMVKSMVSLEAVLRPLLAKLDFT